MSDLKQDIVRLAFDYDLIDNIDHETPRQLYLVDEDRSHKKRTKQFYKDFTNDILTLIGAT